MPILKRFKKCSCNAPERQGQGQGDKKYWLGSRYAKKISVRAKNGYITLNTCV